MQDASRALVERLAGHPGIGESSRTAELTVVGGNGWHIDEASRNPRGPMRVYLGRGEAEAAEADYEVVWQQGHAHVCLLRCTSRDAESWLLSADAERELLAIWHKRAVVEEPVKQRRTTRQVAKLTQHVLRAAMELAKCRTSYELENLAGVPRGSFSKPRGTYGWSLGMLETMAWACDVEVSALLARAEALAGQEGGQ